MLVDAYQNGVAKAEYDPYGDFLALSGTKSTVNPFWFSSELYDGHFYHYPRRVYSPELQRWLTRDPIQEYGGINLFGFVGNESVNYVDLDGLAPQVSGYSYNSATGRFTAQWHHPIPWDNSTYAFYNHQLVEDAGWSKSALRRNQETLPLENHAGPHSPSYLDEVQRRLDQAEKNLRDSGNYNKENCDKALREVVKSINEDIKNGNLAPYNNKTVRAVPDIDPVPYKSKFPLNGFLNDLGSVLNLFQMIDIMVPRTEYQYLYRDGTVRDSKGNIIRYWGA